MADQPEHDVRPTFCASKYGYLFREDEIGRVEAAPAYDPDNWGTTAWKSLKDVEESLGPLRPGAALVPQGTQPDVPSQLGDGDASPKPEAGSLGTYRAMVRQEIVDHYDDGDEHRHDRVTDSILGVPHPDTAEAERLRAELTEAKRVLDLGVQFERYTAAERDLARWLIAEARWQRDQARATAERVQDEIIRIEADLLATQNREFQLRWLRAEAAWQRDQRADERDQIVAEMSAARGALLSALNLEWSDQPTATLVEDLTAELAEAHAEIDRLVDKAAHALADQAMLKGMSVEEGAAVLDLAPPRELVIAWVDAARKMLGPAPNYSETVVSMEVKAAGETERYAFVLQRVGKLTPHQARQRAEAERDELRALLHSIWLYVDWRYVTRQLTTAEKDLWADAVDRHGTEDEPIAVDRWWRAANRTTEHAHTEQETGQQL